MRIAKPALLVLGYLLPCAATWLYFYGGRGPVFTQIVYSLSKLFLLGLPLLWICWLDRERVRLPRPTRKALIEGALSGLVIGLALVGFYWLVLRQSPALAEAGPAIAAKINEFGIGTPARFLGFAVFVVLMNASIEEYFWRGFMFVRLRERMRWPVAALVSGLGFSLHHIVVLSAYVPLREALIFSVGVGLGGVIWAWQLQRTGSIYSAWLSHALVDVAVYVVGFDLVF